ncbi:MAG: hypothetical protein EP303_04900, partial [Deltaproteobacteria bacterium]
MWRADLPRGDSGGAPREPGASSLSPDARRAGEGSRDRTREDAASAHRRGIGDHQQRRHVQRQGIIPERTAQAAGLLQQTLYNQGSIDSLGAQKHLYESQQNDYENIRAQTIAGAGQDYVSVLLAEALLLVQQQNVELTKESVEITKSQEEAGAVLFRDVLRWQSQLYADQQGVVTQKSNVLMSRFT